MKNSKRRICIIYRNTKASTVHGPLSQASSLCTFHNVLQTVLTVSHGERHVVHLTQFAHAYAPVRERKVLRGDAHVP